MWNWLVDKLIARAKRTPYFHLDGYMNRWWLVPYNTVIERAVAKEIGPDHTLEAVYTDGTGMVSPWRRPLAWVIQKLGFAVRVHEILRSDLGRDPHNHPWPYLTIILRGAYIEERFDDTGKLISDPDGEWHGPGSILWRPANSWHKLHLYGGTVTTLFITGKKCQRWGFMTKEGFVAYDKYPGRNA